MYFFPRRSAHDQTPTLTKKSIKQMSSSSIIRSRGRGEAKASSRSSHNVKNPSARSRFRRRTMPGVVNGTQTLADCEIPVSEHSEGKQNVTLGIETPVESESKHDERGNIVGPDDPPTQSVVQQEARGKRIRKKKKPKRDTKASRREAQWKKRNQELAATSEVSDIFGSEASPEVDLRCGVCFEDSTLQNPALSCKFCTALVHEHCARTWFGRNPGSKCFVCAQSPMLDILAQPVQAPVEQDDGWIAMANAWDARVQGQQQLEAVLDEIKAEPEEEELVVVDLAPVIEAIVEEEKVPEQPRPDGLGWLRDAVRREIPRRALVRDQQRIRSHNASGAQQPSQFLLAQIALAARLPPPVPRAAPVAPEAPPFIDRRVLAPGPVPEAPAYPTHTLPERLRGLAVGRFMVNPNSLLHAYRSKKCEYKRVGTDVMIDAKEVKFFNGDGTLLSSCDLVGTWPIWDGKGRVNLASRCLTFLYVEGNANFHGPRDFLPVPAKFLGRILGTGADERVEQACMSIIPRVADSGGIDMVRIQNLAVVAYKKMYQPYIDLPLHIAKVLSSDAYWKEVSDYFEAQSDSWKETSLAIIQARAAGHGVSRQEITRKYQFHRKKAKVVQCVQKVLCATNPIGWAAYAYWEYKDAWLTPSGYRRKAIKELAESVSPAVSQAIRVLPCDMIRIKKYSGSPRELPPVWNQVDLVVRQDPVPSELEEHVEVFGTTIDIPQSIPHDDELNFYEALRHRVAFDRTLDEKVCEGFTNFCVAEINKLTPLEYVEEGEREHLVGTYGTKRGERLFSMRDEDFNHNDVVSKGFVKAEVYYKEDPKSRMICPMTDNVIAHYSYAFKQFADHIKKYWNDEGDVLFTSGCTPDAIGNWVEMMENFAFHAEDDVSNWDGSMNFVFVELEKVLIRRCFSGIPHYEWLLENWGKIKLESKDKSVEIKDAKNRLSGWVCTSVFNSYFNYLLHKYVYSLSAGNYKLMIQGDDACVSRNVPIDQESVHRIYGGLGMVVNVIERNRAQDFQFCSGYIYTVDGRLRWGSKPFKVLSKMGYNWGKHPEKIHKQLLYGQALSLLPVAGHVPVVGAICRAIARSAQHSKIKARHDNRHMNPYRIQGGPCLTPSPETYVEFAERYGLSVDRVREVDDWLERNISLDMFPLLLVDDFFRHGALIDLECEDTRNVNLELSNIDVPMMEEVHKLQGVSNATDAFLSGWRFGAVENDAAAEVGYQIDHRPHHALFSMVSYVNLGWGVALHRAYNRYADSVNGVPADIQSLLSKVPVKHILPCGKKAKSKAPMGNPPKKKKKPVITKAHKKTGKRLLRSLAPVVGVLTGGPGQELYSTFLDTVIGKGAYMGNSVSHGSVASFVGENGVMTVTNHEYIGPLISSMTPTMRVFNINLSSVTLFRWLQPFMTQFQVYEPLEMVFSYVPLSSTAISGPNVAMGTVAMTVLDDPAQPDPTTRVEILDSAMGCETTPSQGLMVGVELDPAMRPVTKYFTRELSDPGDKRFSDLGKWCVLTDGSQQASTVGDLFVSYKVRLSQPKIPSAAFTPNIHWRATNTSYSNAQPFGVSTNVRTGGTVVGTISGSTVTFTPFDGGRYVLIYRAAANVLPTVTITSSTSLVQASGGWGFNNDTIFTMVSDSPVSITVRIFDVINTSTALPSITISLVGGSLFSTSDTLFFQMPGPNSWPVSAIPALLDSSLNAQQFHLFQELEEARAYTKLKQQVEMAEMKMKALRLGFDVEEKQGYELL